MKFCEGERVLCYEPDPTKAKVLYDSKVLDIVVNKDGRGRKTIEYLIHFQGWNSSWDRCVSEEFVLKDTAENRQLQKDLAEKAQLQLGAYLYRKDKKKHSRSKGGDRTTQSSEDGSSGSPIRLDIEDQTSSSECDSSVEDDITPIELTSDMHTILEQDYQFINEKNKLIKLPAEPNVITILDSYWKHYATNQFYTLNEKSSTRNRTPSGVGLKVKPEDVQKNLNICKEMLDGLRIYFDFTLSDLLLYKSEQNQIEIGQAKFLSLPTLKAVINIKTENTDESDGAATITDHEVTHSENEGFHHNQRLTRRSGLRSSRTTELENNGIQAEPGAKVPSTNSFSPEATSPLTKILSWKVLPDHVHSQHPPPPSLVYGATHLLRLFVKLPELLNASNLSENKLKVLMKHFDSFVDYLNDHKDWFGERHYTD